MSTRATYQFKTDMADTTFYVHHDGYPEYAFNYFKNAVESNRKGTLADKFHAANDNSEITESHAVHGDTEYQYTVTEPFNCKDATIIAIKKRWDAETGETFFSGLLSDFIKKYDK